MFLWKCSAYSLNSSWNYWNMFIRLLPMSRSLTLLDCLIEADLDTDSTLLFRIISVLDNVKFIVVKTISSWLSPLWLYPVSLEFSVKSVIYWVHGSSVEMWLDIGSFIWVVCLEVVVNHVLNYFVIVDIKNVIVKVIFSSSSSSNATVRFLFFVKSYLITSPNVTRIRKNAKNVS